MGFDSGQPSKANRAAHFDAHSGGDAITRITTTDSPPLNLRPPRAGFGIITEVEVKRTFKEKLGVEFRNYRILGACNPRPAYEALQLEDKVGTMPPCDVVVQEIGRDRTEIAAIDPVASMQAIDNPSLKNSAERVQILLREVIDGI